MKEMDYGKDYRYAHAYEGSFVSQEFFPEELSGVSFYRSGDNATERKIKEQISKKWGDKY